MQRSHIIVILIMILLLTSSLAACANQNASSDSTAAAPAADQTAGASEPETSATDWPTKAITVLCPYPAGSWTDLCLRALCDQMSADLGQPMSVSNVVGADGATCFTQLAAAEPDGYTIGNSHHSSLTIGVWLEDLPYSIDSFDYIGTFGAYTHGIAVDADSDIYTLDDLVAYAEEKGRIVNGYSGFVNVFNAMTFIKAAGLDASMVSNVAMDDGLAQSLAGGYVDMATYAQSGLASAHDAGEIRIIAALGDHRWSAYPDIPTSVEQGYEVYSTGHQGLCVPKGVPEDVKAKITEAYEHALSNEDFIQILKNMAVETSVFLNGEEYYEHLKYETERAEGLLKELGYL